MITTASIFAYLIVGIIFISYGNSKSWFDDIIMGYVIKPGRIFLGFLVMLWPAVLLIVIVFLFITSLGKIPEMFESKERK